MRRYWKTITEILIKLVSQPNIVMLFSLVDYVKRQYEKTEYVCQERFLHKSWH